MNRTICKQEEWNLWVTDVAMKIADELPNYTITHEYNPHNLREYISVRDVDTSIIFSTDLTGFTPLYKKDKEELANRLVRSFVVAVNGVYK